MGGIEDHKAKTLAATSEGVAYVSEKAVASQVSKGAGKVAGKFVQPAIWVIDYAATGSKPDGVDVGLYGLAFAGPFAAAAALVTGLVKAGVDDHIAKHTRIAAASEPEQVRPYILPCAKYSMMAGDGINAQTIASRGGTAWRSSGDVWVYITDATAAFVCDYQPKVAKTVYQPVLPLSATGNGRFRWHIARG